MPAQPAQAGSPRLLLLAMVLLLTSVTLSADERTKAVGSSWTWLTDYAYLSAEWTLNAESDCEIEVGAGIKAFGKPRGSIHRFKGHYAFTTWGIGAIHVRTTSGATCHVRLDQGDVGAIPVISTDY